MNDERRTMNEATDGGQPEMGQTGKAGVAVPVSPEAHLPRLPSVTWWLLIFAWCLLQYFAWQIVPDDYSLLNWPLWSRAALIVAAAHLYLKAYQMSFGKARREK